MPASYTVPQTARDFLVEHGLASPNEDPAWTPLTGGVSSELWRVDLNQGAVCVKGALEKLKVPGDWRAPVSRNAVEWEWLQFASSVIPGHVPVPLAHDQQRGLFAMSYLPIEQHPVWKSRLLSGDIQVEDAATVGDLIGRLHSASAGDPELAHRFATGENFHTLRIDPYLLATAGRNDALLVNVSRGGLVDTKALVEALDNGRIAAAALDVLEDEPKVDPALLAHSNVVITPHIAFASDASVAELRSKAAEEVIRVLSGKKPLYPCNAPATQLLTTEEIR